MNQRYDVLVVGGGIAGTMAVLAGAAHGLDVAWVAEPIGPDDQSAHWHGHLHRGRLYDPVREADLIEELGRNAAFWWSTPVVPFHTDLSTIAIGPDDAWAAEFQNRIELVSRDIAPPGFLRTTVAAVRTDEAILDGPAFLTAARSRAASASMHRSGRVVGITHERGDWVADGRDASGGRFSMRAGAVIVATGIQASDLVPTKVRLDRSLDVRMSRMLVLRGTLPRAAAIVPSRASGGLFFASREIEHSASAAPDRIWLVSDGFSSSGRDEKGLTDAWWTCSVLERLAEVVDPDLLAGVEVGAYLAPKSRLKSSLTKVPADGVASDLALRFAVLNPAKWSSSPTSAEEAIAGLFPDPRPEHERLAALSEQLRAAHPAASGGFDETWRTVRSWAPLPSLLRPGASAFRLAQGLYRPSAGEAATAEPSGIGAVA